MGTEMNFWLEIIASWLATVAESLCEKLELVALDLPPNFLFALITISGEFMLAWSSAYVPPCVVLLPPQLKCEATS